MVILPLQTETFDAILLNCQRYAKEFIVQRIEFCDRDIYCWVKDDPELLLLNGKIVGLSKNKICISIGMDGYKHVFAK